MKLKKKHIGKKIRLNSWPDGRYAEVVSVFPNGRGMLSAGNCTRVVDCSNGWEVYMDTGFFNRPIRFILYAAVGVLTGIGIWGLLL